ncbi:MAG: lipopolysaccharide heptosyltransferase II [Thermodesulfobacteriota bacterium]|nr:lipopolysaccharide heptosyltransferase II [Thermodesulfobacteriota bacterium]
MKILIVKLSSIGDVVHTLPVLPAILNKLPKAKIDWLIEDEATELVTDHPLLNKVIIFYRRHWIKNFFFADFFKTLREVKDFFHFLREEKYDLIIDFQGLFKSGILTFFAKGKRKLGYDKTRELSHIFLNEKIPPCNIENHAVKRYLNLLKPLNIGITSPEFPLPCLNGAAICVDKLFSEAGINKFKPIISISPASKWESKTWGTEKIAVLSDRLIKYGMQVIYTGSEKDTLLVEDIISFMKEKPINLCGKTSLRELIVVFKKSRLVLTVDSGPMHIAAAVQTPLVALFGPTSPGRTGPYSHKATVIQKNISCSPCFKKRCSHKSCLNEISVEEVFQQISVKIEEEEKI